MTTRDPVCGCGVSLSRHVTTEEGHSFVFADEGELDIFLNSPEHTISEEDHQ
jgi:YHS domain-containing protein